MKVSIVFFPLLVPLITALLCLANWKRVNVQQYIYFLGSILTLVLSVILIRQVLNEGIIHVQVGKWRAPVGITLVADILSSIMVLITSVVSFIIYLYAKGTLGKSHQEAGFYPMVMLMVFGVTGSFLTGDVFNLYVWFEVMLVASFVLITLGGSKEQVEGAIKYVSINFLSTSIFLAGIGILYGTAGTLNMADLAVKLPQVENQGLVSVAAVFFIICFGIKAAIFPLYFWLPASYHTPPIAIAGLIAGLLTKVGVYAFIRFFTLIFTHDIAFTHTVLLYAAGLTMLFGVFGAIIQNDFRKILSFHIVSQIGYMILGLALYTPLAIAGAIFFVVHNILVKTNLFLISGLCNMIHGSYHLKDLGGIYRRFPVVAIFFGISAISLVGTPPFSGFWGKFILAKAGLITGEYWAVGLAFFVSLLTLFSMTKIWANAFLKKLPKEEGYYPDQKSFFVNNTSVVTAVVIMCILILILGFYPAPIITISSKAAEQLLDTRGYINTILRHP